MASIPITSARAITARSALLEVGRCGISEATAKGLLKEMKGGAHRGGCLRHLGMFGNADAMDDELHEIYQLVSDNAKRE